MFKRSQIGRSMIEMLGVLAIIGVLSVGGLAGYSKAMRANKINNALDYINRVKVEYYTGLVNGSQSADTVVGCATVLGEPLDSSIFRCSCKNKNVYVRMQTIDLLKELAVRLNATNHNGKKDGVTSINSYVADGQGESVCLILCKQRSVVGGWLNTYDYCI